jgi:hypothetical protein
VKGHLIARTDLTEAEEHAMRSLCARYFEGVNTEGFHADLEEKNWVLLLKDGDGALAGFTTLHLYETHHRGSPIHVVYSGDTIVEKGARGRSVLSAAWIGAVRRLHRDRPSQPLWWLLLVSGFRTFRFLPTFWRRFLPHPEQIASPEERELLDTLALDRLGERFDPERGVARLPHPMVLPPSDRVIPPKRLADPHVAFFLERNPGHVRGEELVCLTEISPDNLTPTGRRMWDAGEDALAPMGGRGAR